MVLRIEGLHGREASVPISLQFLGMPALFVFKNVAVLFFKQAEK